MPERSRRKATEEQAAEYLRCRTLGHSWDAIPVTEPPSYGVAIDLRCVHCATIRRDIVSRTTAALLSRRYTYPDHYKDTDHHTRTDWRAMWVTTLDEHLRSYGADDEPAQVTHFQRPARSVKRGA